MCAEALGTYLGVFKAFSKAEVIREDGTPAACAIANLYLSSDSKVTPHGDLWKYVCELAKNSPEHFGTSIVFSVGDWFVLDSDGNKLFWIDGGCAYDGDGLPNDKAKEYNQIKANTEKEFVTLGKLFNCDLVDEPAANDSFFSAFSASTLAGKVTEFLDQNTNVLDLISEHPEIVAEFAGRYNSYRTGKGLAPVDLGKVFSAPAPAPAPEGAPVAEEPKADPIPEAPAPEALTEAPAPAPETPAPEIVPEIPAPAPETVPEALAAVPETVPENTPENARANNTGDDTALSAEIASLSALVQSQKDELTALKTRLSVELAGSQPGKFGSGSDNGSTKKAYSQADLTKAQEKFGALAESILILQASRTNKTRA
jgi:hypothetical protein